MRRRTLLTAGLALPWFSPVPSLLPVAAAAAERGAKRLVVVFANGGWDATMVFDPKLGSPDIEGPEIDEDPDDPDDVEAVQTFSGIPIVTNPVKRPAVTTFFERWGARTVVVNGIWVGSVAHDPCRWRMLSGRVDGRGPDMVAVSGSVLGAGLPLGSVDTSGLALAGPLSASMGSVGKRGQLEMLLAPEVSPPVVDHAPAFDPSLAEQDLIAQFLDQRAASGAARHGRQGQLAYEALREARDRANRLRADTTLIDGLKIGQGPTLETLVDMTTAMLAGDVCRAALLDSGHTWDTHENNVNQHSHYEALFTDLNRLVGALETAGLLDDTVVAVLSEMSRTPKRNAALGKDHWPHTSALLLGGPVRGGRVCGATDFLQESLPMDLATGVATPSGDLLRYNNFMAGILAMLDIDASPWLPGAVPFLGATV